MVVVAILLMLIICGVFAIKGRRTLENAIKGITILTDTPQENSNLESADGYLLWATIVFLITAGLVIMFAILQWVYAKKSYFTTSTATLILMMLSMLAIIIGGILCALAVYNIKRAPSYSDSNEVLKEARSYAIVAVFLSLAIFTLILAYLVVINQAPLDT